jgi:hypothetical protein
VVTVVPRGCEVDISPAPHFGLSATKLYEFDGWRAS